MRSIAALAAGIVLFAWGGEALAGNADTPRAAAAALPPPRVIVLHPGVAPTPSRAALRAPPSRLEAQREGAMRIAPSTARPEVTAHAGATTSCTPSNLPPPATRCVTTGEPTRIAPMLAVSPRARARAHPARLSNRPALPVKRIYAPRLAKAPAYGSASDVSGLFARVEDRSPSRKMVRVTACATGT